jgi:hypothetical protein
MSHTLPRQTVRPRKADSASVSPKIGSAGSYERNYSDLRAASNAFPTLKYQRRFRAAPNKILGDFPGDLTEKENRSLNGSDRAALR